MNKVVLDANVYVKIFKKENDSNKAHSLINLLIDNGVDIIEPQVVINETVTTCEYARQDIEEVCNFFKFLISSKLMNIIELSPAILERTIDITKEGHGKSGFPTFNDSMYQSIAIEEGAVFITADRRHYEKTKHLGNIELLGNMD